MLYIMEVPFAGHKVLNAMRDSGILVAFLKQYIDKGEVLDFNLDESGCIYFCQRGRFHYKNKKYDLAISDLNKSLSIEFNSEAANYLLRSHMCKSDKLSILDLFRLTILKNNSLDIYPRSLVERAVKIIY